MTEMEDLDYLADVNDHLLIGCDLESHVNMNDIESTGNGDDEVEIVVCSVTTDPETANMGESLALNTALNSYKFDVDGTVYTIIVDSEAIFKRDNNIKEGDHEKKVLPKKDGEQYRTFLSEALPESEPEQKDLVAKEIGSKEKDELSLNDDSSFSENEVDCFNDTVASVNEQAEIAMPMQNNINENLETVENEKHGELLNPTDSSMTRQKWTEKDFLANDDSVDIVNERVRHVLNLQENSVSSLIEQGEKIMLLKETICVYDDKKNDSHTAKSKDESPFHPMSSNKKQKYDSFSNIQKHSKKYKPRDKHICKTCDKHFASYGSFRGHLCHRKSNHPSFACKVCRKRNLNMHRKFCNGKRLYISDCPSVVCNFCSQTFPWKRNLVRHMKTCKGIGQNKSYKPPFACNICPRTYSCKRNLTRHMKLHRRNHAITCEVCSKNLSGKFELEKHMLIHSKLEQLVCDICMQSFGQKNSLTKHIQNHFELGNFDCKICLVQFSNESSLIRHMIDHPDQNFTVAKLKEQQQQNIRGSYSCDFCLQSFNKKASLVKHMELHCSLDNLACEICFEEFSVQSALNSHMAIHLLAKDDSIPCVYEQDNSLSSFAKDDSMSNVNEHEEDNSLSVVERERKDIAMKKDSVLSDISLEEKLSLVKEIVNELKGKAVHMKENLMSSVNGEANIGNSITSTRNEKLKDLKIKDDSMSSVNHPIGENCHIKQSMILSVNENKENLNDLLTLVKDQHIETLNAMETPVSDLIQQEGKHFLMGKELSAKDKNEQDSNKAKQDLNFTIHNLPRVIKRENGSVLNIHGQVKLRKHKPGPLKSHTCETCHKRFSSAVCLKRHTSLHKPDPPSFTCDVCSHKAPTKGNLIRHMKVHGICGICWKQYSRRKDLELHMTVHSTKPEPYFCDVCSQTFSTRRDLVRHIENHFRVGKLVCKICSIQFPNTSSMSLHMRGKHLDFGTDATLKRQTQKQSCPVCHKQFLNGNDLNRHMNVHSKPQAFFCDLCPKEFSSQKHLGKHRRNHLRLGFITCKVCSKEFRDKAGLGRHMVTHSSSNQNKLYCYQCLRNFGSLSEFKSHMHQHEGSHTCGICSRVFSFKTNLTRHVKKHHFKLDLLCCQICGRETQSKSDLTRHMVAMHSDTCKK